MEKKITCPVCFSGERCFEDVQEQADKTFSSFMCFKCGYTSNSAYKYNIFIMKIILIQST